MPDTLCKCGCGGPVYAASKTGFLRGHHMHGVPESSTPPQQVEDQTEPVAAEEMVEIPAHVECLMTEPQLERIWAKLTLHEKATAVLTALELPL